MGKSHWNIKKMSIMGTILYLFFRTQDGKRIYFFSNIRGLLQVLAKRVNSMPLTEKPHDWYQHHELLQICVQSEDVMFFQCLLCCSRSARFWCWICSNMEIPVRPIYLHKTNSAQLHSSFWSPKNKGQQMLYIKLAINLVY